MIAAYGAFYALPPDVKMPLRESMMSGDRWACAHPMIKARKYIGRDRREHIDFQACGIKVDVAACLEFFGKNKSDKPLAKAAS
jgi:hypothetical protein